MTDRQSTEAWIDVIEAVVAALLQLGILAVAVISAFRGNWLAAFSGGATLLLSFAPAMLERRLKVRLPIEVTLFVSLFLFASFVLGEVGDFYERLWWWDLLLHGSSAFVVGLIGFLTVYVFHMTQRVRIAEGYVAAITFASAVTVGTLWEIFEFGMDHYFGLNMQRSGLVDTMTDLIVNAIGAVLAATVGYYYMAHGDELMGHRAIRNLVERGGAHRSRPMKTNTWKEKR